MKQRARYTFCLKGTYLRVEVVRSLLFVAFVLRVDELLVELLVEVLRVDELLVEVLRAGVLELLLLVVVLRVAAAGVLFVVVVPDLRTLVVVVDVVRVAG